QVLCHPVTDKLGFTGCYSLCIFYIIYYSLHSNNCSRISGFLLAGSNKIFLAFSLAPVLCHFISCVYVCAVGLCLCVRGCGCVCVCVCVQGKKHHRAPAVTTVSFPLYTCVWCVRVCESVWCEMCESVCGVGVWVVLAVCLCVSG